MTTRETTDRARPVGRLRCGDGIRRISRLPSARLRAWRATNSSCPTLSLCYALAMRTVAKERPAPACRVNVDASFQPSPGVTIPIPCSLRSSVGAAYPLSTVWPLLRAGGFARMRSNSHRHRQWHGTQLSSDPQPIPVRETSHPGSIWYAHSLMQSISSPASSLLKYIGV